LAFLLIKEEFQKRTRTRAMNTTNATIVLRHLRRLSTRRTALPPPDAELLGRFTADRDEAAFAELMRRHGPMVLGVCRSVLHQEQDAEDAFQAAFLTLARKAGSIRHGAALAGWLHEVAYRAAIRARAGAFRRRACERKALTMAATDPALDLTLRDLQRVLHEELRQLPEKYRLPLVLCYLEGCTQETAATRLDCSQDTLRGRLNRGREHLRWRLRRRGVVLSAALCAAELFLRAPPVPAALADGLTGAAVAAAAGSGASGLVSARACALAEGVCQTLSTRVQLAALVLMAAGLCAGAALALGYTGARELEPPAASSETAPSTPVSAKEVNDDRQPVPCAGCVLNPEGSLLAGAKLVLLYTRSRAAPAKVMATSGADGAFHFAVGPPFGGGWQEYPWDWGERLTVAAAAGGYGFAAARLGRAEAGTATLRLLRDDVPLRGRILNAEGKPVAGVRVSVDGVAQNATGGDLTAWLAAAQAGEGDRVRTSLEWFAGASLGLLVAPVTTAADGRFEIKGIGRERLVRLRIEGPTIASAQFWAMTRAGSGVHAPAARGYPDEPGGACHGAVFDHVAVSSRPVVGVVRDRDTGKPLAGVKVHGYAAFHSHYVDECDLLQTRTDRDGRYRLVGLPSASGLETLILADTEDLPYFPAVEAVADATDSGPVTVDFAMKRGVWVQGRVTEKGTGKPLGATVHCYCFQDNPNLKGLHPRWLPLLRGALSSETKEDGSFRVAALPGPGLIGVRAYHEHYVRAGADAGRNIKASRGTGDFLTTTVPGNCVPSNYHALVQIAPRAGEEAITCDVTLDPGLSVAGTVLDPEGKPLAGARLLGFADMLFWRPTPLPGADFRVQAIREGRPRQVLFVHHGRRLAGSVILRGGEQAPIQVRLGPWGTFTGRVVTDNGEPLSGVHVDADWDPKFSVSSGSFPGGAWADKDGRFRIEGLVPGLKYHVRVSQSFTELGIATGRTTGLTLRPGQTMDLGTIEVKTNP
jgi:RNA polymerase sigma factor (sigma-70 family)